LREHEADVLGISATVLASVPAVVDLVRQVRLAFGPGSPQIVVGGAAFRLSPGLAADLGALGPASDVRHALALPLRRPPAPSPG